MGGRAVQLAMCAGVLVLGTYLALTGAGEVSAFGWLVAVLGAFGLVATLALPSRRPPRR